jgi:hypothetical protein
MIAQRVSKANAWLERTKAGLLLFFFWHPSREDNNLGSLLFAQNADAPIYIPVAKARIPAAPVTCERICGSM